MSVESVSRLEQETEIIEQLGEGGFGSVLKVKDRMDEQIYAVKKIPKNDVEDLDMIMREIRLLAKLKHDNIVRYYSSWREVSKDQTPDDTDSESFSSRSTTADRQRQLTHDTVARQTNDIVSPRDFDDFEDFDGFDVNIFDQLAIDTFKKKVEADNAGTWEEDAEEVHFVEDCEFQCGKLDTDGDHTNDDEISCGVTVRFYDLYIKMEFCDSTLRRRIEEGLFEKQSEVFSLFRQILKGLKYIHEMNILHRDLNPKNIFLCNGIIKIGDFGLSRANVNGIEERCSSPEGSGSAESAGSLTSGIGTALYRAPEVKSSKTYGKEADMYSIGLVFFEMNYRPITTEAEKIPLFSNLIEKKAFPDDFDKTRDQAKIIIDRLLNTNAKERLSPDKLLDPENNFLPHEPTEEKQFRATLMSALSAGSSDQRQEVLNMVFENLSQNKIANPNLLRGELSSKIIDKFQKTSEQHGAEHYTFLDLVASNVAPITNLDGQHIQVLLSNGTMMTFQQDLPSTFRLLDQHKFDKNRRLFVDGHVWGRTARQTPYKELGFFIFKQEVGEFAEAELLLFLQRFLVSFPEADSWNFTLCVSHDELETAFFMKTLKMEQSSIDKLAISISRRGGSAGKLEQLIRRFPLNANHYVASYRHLPDSFEKIQCTLDLARGMGFSIKTEVHVLLRPTCCQTSGFKFELLYVKGTQTHKIAAGGRFLSVDGNLFRAVTVQPSSLSRCLFPSRDSTANIDVLIFTEVESRNPEAAKLFGAVLADGLTCRVLGTGKHDMNVSVKFLVLLGIPVPSKSTVVYIIEGVRRVKEIEKRYTNIISHIRNFKDRVRYSVISQKFTL